MPVAGAVEPALLRALIPYVGAEAASRITRSATEAVHQLVLNVQRHAGSVFSSETRVRVFASDSVCGVEVDVVDDGPGIAETLREQLETDRNFDRRMFAEFTDVLAWLFSSRRLWGFSRGLGRLFLVDAVRTHHRNALIAESDATRVIVSGQPGHGVAAMRCDFRRGTRVCIRVCADKEKRPAILADNGA